MDKVQKPNISESSFIFEFPTTGSSKVASDKMRELEERM
jgi:hypothetical protein